MKFPLCIATGALALFCLSSCAPGPEGGPGGSGGSSVGTGDGSTGSGGSAPGSGGGSSAAGGTLGSGGSGPGSGGGIATGGSSPGSGGSGAGTGGRGGATVSGGRGGAAAGGRGGNPGTGGMTASGGAGGAPPPLDCGPMGVVVENHGSPRNRVNYVIVGDGYTQAELDTTLMTHISTAMAKRFTDIIGQPYLRYRKFVNICVLRMPSSGAICGSSLFGCCGTDSSRLATCDSNAVNTAISANIPATFEVDWKAVVLNGSSWWNTGATLMLWSGGNRDAGGAALHEGGHGFHAFADEYCASGTGAACGTVNGGSAMGSENARVNMTGNPTTTTDKWPMWLGYDQVGATGLQGTFSTGSGPYRPSINSQMNSLFGTNPNTAFNSVSREKMVMDIWQRVVPIDSTVPVAGPVSGATTLQVNVIDPAIIDVDWSVDGTVVAAKGGTTFNVAARGLTPGSHTVSAKAYDNAGTDLVRQVPGTTWGRQHWARSVQTVTWMVTIP